MFSPGLPFNSWLGKHVPSYQGCVKREELFQLKIFSPLSFKSLASTPEDCKRACALQSYRLAGLFQGIVFSSFVFVYNGTSLSLENDWMTWRTVGFSK
jgi:hypothetical protein